MVAFCLFLLLLFLVLFLDCLNFTVLSLLRPFLATISFVGYFFSVSCLISLFLFQSMFPVWFGLVPSILPRLDS